MLSVEFINIPIFGVTPTLQSVDFSPGKKKSLSYTVAVIPESSWASPFLSDIFTFLWLAHLENGLAPWSYCTSQGIFLTSVAALQPVPSENNPVLRRGSSSKGWMRTTPPVAHSLPFRKREDICFTFPILGRKKTQFLYLTPWLSQV